MLDVCCFLGGSDRTGCTFKFWSRRKRLVLKDIRRGKLTPPRDRRFAGFRTTLCYGIKCTGPQYYILEELRHKIEF